MSALHCPCPCKSNKMSERLNNIVEKTRVLTRIPALLHASIASSNGDDVARIQTTWSQSVAETAETIKFERTFLLDHRSLRAIASTPPQPVGQHNVVCYSPSHRRKAVFRKKEPDAKKEQWLLEIWSEGQLIQILDLSAIDKHGVVYSSGEFSSFQWSADETLLLYIAEKRRAPAASFFDDHAKTGSERGAESRYYSDWGEQQTGQYQPVVVVLDVAAGQLTALTPQQDVSLGQPRWRCHRGVHSVVAVAWENTPRRLGLIYCSNRPSHLVELPLDGSAGCQLSGEGTVACRSPRVSADGSAVLWLQSAAGGPHHAGARLMRRQMDGGAVTVLVDLVDVPSDPDRFTGLYLSQLPADCWVSDAQLCLSTPVGTQLRTMTVDAVSGSLAYHDCQDVTVLAANSQLVVGVRSRLLQPHQLVAKRPADAAFMAVTETTPICGGNVRPLTFIRAEPTELAGLPYSGLLVLPAAGTAAPLVLFPHGGPHSVMTDTWSAHVALFCQLGLAVLLINYRGSAGAGERALQALLGRVGSLDVADCAHAARKVLSSETALLDAGRVAAYGGSHGGFLVTHLSGQHPELIGAVVARNPVCDIAGMLEGTDIPDWNHVESGEPYDSRLTPTPQLLAAMLGRSPISHVGAVRAPTLLLLGTADRRVPAYQALYYREALRQRGVETDIRVYDDCHPLAKPAVNADVMVHAALWICEKLDYCPA